MLTTELVEGDPDALLMQRSAKGDAGAFERLVDRWQAGLIQYFAMVSHDPQMAEDLAQEVFLRLYRNRHGYNPTAKFKTFLYCIAQNLWKDQLRGKRRRGPLVPFEEDLAVDEGRGVACSDPGLALDWNNLVKAVAALPEKQRIVFLLSRIEEMSFPEIAQVLDIPLGTVKSRMHHAMNALQRSFGKGRGHG